MGEVCFCDADEKGEMDMLEGMELVGDIEWLDMSIGGVCGVR